VALARIPGAVLFLVAASAASLPAAAEELKCATAAEIRAAVGRAKPGDLISVKPGDYEMGAAALATGRDGEKDKGIILTCEGGRDYARLKFSGEIGLRLRNRHWTVCGIHVDGDADKTDAPVLIDGSGGAGDLVITDCRVSNCSSSLLQATRSREKAADNVTVEWTEFYGCQATAVNLFSGDGCVVRHNYVHDYGKGGNPAYGICLRGGGSAGVVEANVVDAGGAGTTLGISFGGGLSNEKIRPLGPDGQPLSEHENGICRNNIVVATADRPYHTNKASGCRFLNNLAWGCSGFQRQNAAGTDPELANNLIGGTLKGASADSKANPAAVKREWFVKPEAMDFRLSEDGKKELVGKGAVVVGNPEDFFGTKRGVANAVLGPVLPDAKESTAWVDRRK
jgi:hypothetical protein